jgi:PAS domain S-box-containing protein
MKLTPEIRGIVLDALEQAQEAFFITDAKVVIVYAKPAFERLFGCAVREALGKNAGTLKSGEHPDEFYAGIWETISSGREWTGRFVSRHKNGAKCISAASISPVRNGEGAITNYRGLLRDITGEAELEERLTQSRKLDALGLLAGQLSHDFNNLLTIVIGSIEVIIEDLPAQSVNIKLAQGILQASKESVGLLRQLLIFARRQGHAPNLAALNAVIGEAKKELDRLSGPLHKLEYSLAPELARVNMEPEQFKQALINLVKNARDAMPSGGTIKIATHNQCVQKGGAAGIKAGDYAVMEVSDAGIGIPPEAMEHLFEPFFTTKPKGKGAGLGLSSVYGIIKQHKGEIIAESRPGEGAVFKIYLPKAA